MTILQVFATFCITFYFESVLVLKYQNIEYERKAPNGLSRWVLFVYGREVVGSCGFSEFPTPSPLQRNESQ